MQTHDGFGWRTELVAARKKMTLLVHANDLRVASMADNVAHGGFKGRGWGRENARVGCCRSR